VNVDSTLKYAGEVITLLAKATETNGCFAFMEVKVQPGTEPPPHIHEREHELFYVLEGAIRFYTPEKTFDVQRPNSWLSGRPREMGTSSDSCGEPIALSFDDAGPQDGERPDADLAKILFEFTFHPCIKKDESTDAPMAETSAKFCVPACELAAQTTTADSDRPGGKLLSIPPS
jgi:Cupin domain